jgi:hypothetical protein
MRRSVLFFELMIHPQCVFDSLPQGKLITTRTYPRVYSISSYLISIIIYYLGPDRGKIKIAERLQ